MNALTIAAMTVGGLLGAIGVALLVAVIRKARREARRDREAAAVRPASRRGAGGPRSRPVRHNPPIVVVVDREPVTQIIPRVRDNDPAATAVLPRVRDGQRG